MLLDSIEARIIGCLLEKEVTTPEQYPLSLNALTLACNQKTSREPVMELSDADVLDGINRLLKQHLVMEESGFGARVSKYRHRFCNTEFADLQLPPPQLAIICLLLLRGPQTAGELRTRAQRLYDFADLTQVEQQLQQLQQQQLVIPLPREAGKREQRFGHQFAAEPTTTDAVAVTSNPLELRVAELEQQLATVQQQLATVQQQLAELLTR